jgi:hypothetical protein
MANWFVDLSPATACKALRSADLVCAPHEIAITRRDERWAVFVPGERVAWFPASELGSRQLAFERQVLRLVGQRCSFQVPRPLWMSHSGIDVRQMVPGRCDPAGLFRRCQIDATLAQRIGRAIGTMLAQQHTRITADDAGEWLPRRPAWPERAEWIRERLPSVVDDGDLVRSMAEVIDRYEAVTVDADDHVMLHGGVGFHNLALDSKTDAVNGLFDYDGAAWADRHHDFRYLLFDVGRDDMLDAALAVYEPGVGRRIDRSRVQLYNAACAISYVAFRSGVPPEQEWCGRTLAGDLAWARDAMARLA